MLVPLLALPLAAPQAVQDPRPALLSEAVAPADWTREALAFPLGFAPGIELEGREELAFAPGWSDPDAPDWWTYVLALEVAAPGEEPLAVDAAWLEGFLNEYYRGLCGAVGGSRGLEVDAQAIAARVSGGGQRFAAELELVDAFGDGRAFGLGLELFVHPDPAGGEVIQLLGLASPAPRDAPVWARLEALGAAWVAERPVPVSLNHVYFVPDLATYEALRESEFLREFAVLEERTTRRGDMSYTGLYLYGRSTYFEFLKPDASIGFPPGGTGVAFGVELEGGLERLAAQLGEHGVQSFAGAITRELTVAGESEQVPWFDILGIQAATAEQRLQLFAMEYDPGFLARWHAPSESGSLPGRIDRAAVLARYTEVLGGPEEPLFVDVDRVRLSLDDRERVRLLQVCEAVRAADAGASEAFLGPDLAIRACAGFELAFEGAREEPGGVLLFQGRIARSVAERIEHDFGQARLILDEDLFTLVFEGLPTPDTK